MEQFTIQKNDFLSHDCTGYFHLYYVGYGQPGNPDYLNTLKNIFVFTHPDTLRAASRQAAALMIQDIPQIMEAEGLDEAVLMAVPRSKSGMCNWQLGFKAAVRTAVKALQDNNLSVIDGTDFIFRHTSTKMTHLRSLCLILRILVVSRTQGLPRILAISSTSTSRVERLF